MFIKDNVLNEECIPNLIFRPRTVPAVAVIFSEARNGAGTLRRRDLRGLNRMIKKRSPNSFLKPPTYSEMKYAVQKRPPRSVDFVKTAYNR